MDRYPVSFKDGTCGCCGEQAVIILDKFDRKSKSTEIYPIYRMRCVACHRDFYILWDDMDDEAHTASPYPVSEHIVEDFLSFVHSIPTKREALSYDKYEITNEVTF